MDLLQLVKDKPVLSLGGAFAVITAAIGGFLAVDERYAHSKDVPTKAATDKHETEDKARSDKHDRNFAWLLAGQAKTDATMARNRTNECLIRPPKTDLEMSACAQYRQDMDDANLRYQQAQEMAKRASR